MATRVATKDDIADLLKVAPGRDAPDFESAIDRKNAIWIKDDAGAFMQIARSDGPVLPTPAPHDAGAAGTYIGPLYPLESRIGSLRLFRILGHLISEAWEQWPEARAWPIKVGIPKENKLLADVAEVRFPGCRRIDDKHEGGIVLSLPTLKAAYERVQLWPVSL